MTSANEDEQMHEWIDSLSLEELRSTLKYMVILNADAVQSAMRYVQQKKKTVVEEDEQDNILHHDPYHYYNDPDKEPENPAPLRRRSRSHDTDDDEDDSRSISSRPRRSLSIDSMKSNSKSISITSSPPASSPAQETPPLEKKKIGMVSFLSPSPHSGSYKTLVVLCTMKPSTKLQAKHQDKSMALCKSVGIKPYILLKESKQNECAELWRIIGPDLEEAYPQFFLQHQQQVQYLGSYEMMEEILLTELPASAPPSATEEDQQHRIRHQLLGIPETVAPDPQKMKALMSGNSPSSSSSSSSSSNPRNVASMAAHPPARKKSATGPKKPNKSLHAHLENLNQPGQAYFEAEGSGDIVSDDGSLGDDMQLLFDPPEPTKKEKVKLSQKLAVQQQKNQPQHHVIQEEDEDESTSNTGNDPRYPQPSGNTLVATTTTSTTNLGSVQVAASPSGTWTLKEIVTLKKTSTAVSAGAPNENGPSPNSAFPVTLKPASQRAAPQTFQPPQTQDQLPKKKHINPYYALDKYSQGGGAPPVATTSPNKQSSTPAPPAPAASPSNQQSSWMQAYNHQQEEASPSEGRTTPDQRGVDRSTSWEKKFLGRGACYLVYDAVRGELNIHYSEMPIIGAVGVWTSPDINMFKQAQGLSQSELIGNCASGVVQDRKLYCQGWCQFVKAAKSMDATVTVLEVGVPVDFYLYINGSTTKVDGEFETARLDAVACVPRNSDFPFIGIKGKKWSKGAKKLGAVALFNALTSTDGEGHAAGVTPIPEGQPIQQHYQQQVPTVQQQHQQQHQQPTTFQHDQQRSSTSVQQDQPQTLLVQQQPVEAVQQATTSAPAPAPPATLTVSTTNAHDGFSTSMDAPTPKGGACYLVYEPDSSGRIVEHYSMAPIAGAIGRWAPKEGGKKIAGFKFKRNVGRNVLTGNCSAGVQGRKSYCNGWCQFVRSAFVMDSEVMLWDPLPGNKGMHVDVYLYYNDSRPTHQTQRMLEGVVYETEKLLAVSCIPKNTPFYEGMAVDLLKWLGDGSTYGYSSKMA
ncbi:MAG: hypothetical protein SGILL_004736 [Bacillariaceae sp.]